MSHLRQRRRLLSLTLMLTTAPSLSFNQYHGSFMGVLCSQYRAAQPRPFREDYPTGLPVDISSNMGHCSVIRPFTLSRSHVAHRTISKTHDATAHLNTPIAVFGDNPKRREYKHDPFVLANDKAPSQYDSGRLRT